MLAVKETNIKNITKNLFETYTHNRSLQPFSQDGDLMLGNNKTTDHILPDFMNQANDDIIPYHRWLFIMMMTKLQ